jgi:alpha-L-rhamnosidase
VFWDLLQQDDEPSYGFFMASTPANPGGMTTIGERWNRGDSKNHMILAQIEEWFHAGIAGIRAADEAIAYDRLIFQPKPVGDLRRAAGTYQTPKGEARSAWVKTRRTFTLTVTVPSNTEAEVRVPAAGRTDVHASARATYSSAGEGYVIYRVPSGTHIFTATTAGG